MSFVDKVQVEIKAGRGGDGHLSFRHEKFIDRGGPDGGDGGDGGDIVVRASRNENTLADFRYQKLLAAEPGAPGGKQRQHGKRGQNLIVPLPVGTVITDDKGRLLADLTTDNQEVVIARGGKGGFGNAHFISSTRQAPRVAEKGEPGDELTAIFEIKMIADVGLVGLPNAGKSTLLSVISNARPQIADYPFTTLTPNLGVVDVDGTTSLLIADIPGLIAGAAQGKGLGDEFLRHVERTGVLLHLIDAYEPDITAAYLTVQKELAAYTVDLSRRPQIVVLTKTEGLDPDVINGLKRQLQTVVSKHTDVMAVSSLANQGTRELLRATLRLVMSTRETKVQQPVAKALPVFRLPDTEAGWSIVKTGDGFRITGQKIERFANRTDFQNVAALQRLHDILRRNGVIHALKRQGIKPGQTIYIGTHVVEYPLTGEG